MRLLRTILLTTLALWATAVSATDIPGGTISSSQTWGRKNSPYTVTGDVTVSSGATLTIESGVVVYFTVGTGLTVNGGLQAVGTVTDSIFFVRAVGNKTGWYGIDILTATACNIEYARIAGANTSGILVNDAAASLTLSDCVLQANNSAANGGAVKVLAGTLNMLRCIVVDNTAASAGGGLSNEGGTATVVNCTFSGNTGGEKAGAFVSVGGTTTLINSIFWNDAPAEGFVGSGTVSAKYCDFAGGVPGGVTSLAGNIALDPLFVNAAAYDFNLNSRSPCIDAGDTKSPQDPDGTVADIGARFFDQAAAQSLALPAKVVSESGPTFFANVTGTLMDARGVNFAFVYNRTVAVFDTLLATAFDGLADAMVQVNATGDTVFIAMTASESKTVADTIIARMGFVMVNPGMTQLTWLPDYVDIDDELPLLTDGSIRVNAYYGDVTTDGSLSAFDAAEVLRYVVHLIFSIDVGRADVSANTRITAYDAALILYKTVHPEYLLPVRGGTPIKPAQQTEPIASWERAGDGWMLAVGNVSEPLGVDLTLRLPEGATLASDAAMQARREGDLVTVAIASPVTVGELLRIEGTAAQPEIVAGTINDREIALAQPVSFALAQNTPNPFNPRTAIGFNIPEAGAVRLAIYDVNGRLVRTLVDAELAAGEYTITWDGIDASGRAVASGVYLYRLTSDDGTATRRLTLVR